MTLSLAALVVQIQTAKVASCPGSTVEGLENDCTRTQSCAFGGDEVDELLGVGLGLGLALAVGESELVDGLGLGLVLVLVLGLALAEVVVALGLGLGLLLALLLGDGLDEAGALVASRTASVGMEEHTLLAAVAASAASAWLKAAELMKAKPETAAITAGLTSCALTFEPRFGPGSASCPFRLGRPESL